MLVVAGDVSDDLGTFGETMRLLTRAFRAVAFVPGNHDLWVRRKERGLYDSLGKLERLTALCGELGVATAPTRYAEDGLGDVEGVLAALGDGDGAGVGGGSRRVTPPPSVHLDAVPPVYVFPVLSWYHSSWDREPDVLGATPIERVMMDFHVCSFASEPHLEGCGHESVAEHLDLLNEPGFSRALTALEAERAARRARGLPPPVVVSASHFLPHQALLPDKRFLRFPNLAKASGSDYLSRRVEALGPHVHIFGHTHFRWDATLPDGVRYVQCPLGYPAERARNGSSSRPWEPWVLAEPDEVLRAWQEDIERGEGGFPAQKQCYWSSMIPNEVSAMRYRQGLQGREGGEY